jgi:ATP-dependent DNA ligase
MILKTLFKQDTNGRLRQWMVEVDDLNPQYRTQSGIMDMKLTTTKWKMAKEKNVGRSNYRSAQDQALFEAQNLITKQKGDNWVENKSEVQNVDTIFEPMLAQDYQDRKKELEGKKIFSQPKLDGIRCNIDETNMWSRKKKPFLSIPHLSYLIALAKKHNCVFDGELYNHKMKDDFNGIISLVRKLKPTTKDLEDSKKKIKFYVYDCYFKNEKNLKFSDRFKKLKEILKDQPSIEFVETISCDLETIDEIYDEYLTQGYEGQIVRLDEKYDMKRSKSLLKRKDFMDDEYEIIEIIEGEGNRSGMAGYASIKNKKGLMDFRSNIKGDFEFLKEMLLNKETYKGKKATIRFFGLTPDKKPRFPYLVAVRDYE